MPINVMDTLLPKDRSVNKGKRVLAHAGCDPRDEWTGLSNVARTLPSSAFLLKKSFQALHNLPASVLDKLAVEVYAGNVSDANDQCMEVQGNQPFVGQLPSMHSTSQRHVDAPIATVPNHGVDTHLDVNWGQLTDVSPPFRHKHAVNVTSVSLTSMTDKSPHYHEKPTSTVL